MLLLEASNPGDGEDVQESVPEGNLVPQPPIAPTDLGQVA
jgi:hypothetical protein